ncbi:lytic transglycosylase domain-containing protein [Mesorhizobium sp. B2-3-5]|nr:lytic transglycosylase domain-containing protein [Mesorhizobium sp. B2-3-5]
MTDPLSRPTNRHLLLALTSTALVAVWTPSSAAAEDARSGTELTSNHAAIRPFQASDESVAAVFDARWGTDAREYELRQDGQLHRTSTATASLPRPGSSGPGASPAPEKYSQFDSSPVPHRNPHAKPCGASPISAAEIARLVRAAAYKYDVDPDFALAIATVESQLDRVRNSPKGARGPMQLMPATAGELGVSDICDPADNIDGGVRFLRQLFATYRDPLIVAAAYNAGAARVDDYGGGIPPLPETVRFVAEVIKLRPGPSSADPQARAADAAVDLPTADTETISPTTRRQWVGGVMQF